MYLLSVKTIREALGFDDMTDINSAIEAALDASTAQLAARLSTEFDRGEVRDDFWIDRPGFTEGRHYATEFRLTRACLVARPAIFLGPTLDALVEAPFPNMKFDAAKGIARDIGTRFTGQYVSFRYQAGFQPEDPPPTPPVGWVPSAYKEEQVPKWLREAAKIQTYINLADSPAVTEAGVKLDVVTLGRNLTSLLVNYIRYAPVAHLPL